MRILFLAPSYSPKLGGVEIHAQRVAEILVRQGHIVTVLTTSHQVGLAEKEVIQGVQVIRSSFVSGSQKLAMWRFTGQHLSNLWRADVIHVHDVMWWLAPWLPLLFWKPIHLTHHGWEGAYPVPFKNKMQRWLWAHLASSLTHIGAWIQEFYWEKPDLVMYGGVDEQMLDRGLKKTPSIVFLGRLEQENDVPLYLEAARLLKKSMPQLKITWVGDGAFRQQAAELGEVTGWISDPSKYVQHATLVWASSYLSLLQAQSLGKVVGALYSHQLKQRYLEVYSGQEAMILESNPEKFAERCGELLSNSKERGRLENLASEWATKQTWERVVERYLKLWL